MRSIAITGAHLNWLENILAPLPAVNLPYRNIVFGGGKALG